MCEMELDRRMHELKEEEGLREGRRGNEGWCDVCAEECRLRKGEQDSPAQTSLPCDFSILDP